jgi:ribosomal protein L7/L12
MSSSMDADALAARIEELERRVALLEAGIAPQAAAAASSPELDAEVVQHLRDNNLIAAIKRYRELTGVGLAEAKHAIDAANRGVHIGI